MEYNYYYSKDLELPELHRAAKDGNRAKVRKLLKSGTSPNEIGNYKDMPLMWAVIGGDSGIVADLLKAGAIVDATDINKRTPMHYAAENGRDEFMADLLAAGANAKAADMLGMTALHLATIADSPFGIAALVKNGANPNCKNKEGETPMHYAALYGYPAAIRALVKNGADANLPHKTDGFTALHLAAMNDAIVSVGLLLDYRVNKDAKDKDGDTAMHRAALCGNIDVVNALINAGAKTNPLNNANETPLLLAQKAGHTDTADALISADKTINSAKEPQDDSIAKKVYDGAWRRIVFIDSRGGKGSGVIVAPDLVATNFHVVECGDILVFKAKESKKRMPFRRTTERGIDDDAHYPAKMRAGQRKPDFCLLEVPGLGGEDIPMRASHTLRVGEEVFAIGNPADKDLTLSPGIISQLRDNGDDKCREIQTNAAISPGSSGGGLFDRDGNLIGITTRGVNKEKGDPRVPQNLNFAIPADLIWGHLPNTPKQKPAKKAKKRGKR